MTAKLHLWWQQIKQHRRAFGVVGIALVVVVALIIVGYGFDWTGFNGYNQVTTTHIISGPSAGTVTRTEVYQPGKALWDWLQLLIVPLALAVVALLFQLANTRTERQIALQRYDQDQQIALDKQHEDLLQAYLDHISELLLKESLHTSPSEEVRNVARVRTITVLTQLDARRIGYVFAFLREAGLMSKTSDSSVVSLKDADLRAVKWDQATLSGANLSSATLSSATLSGANLSGANLSGANLSGATLSGATLSGVDLHGANLSQANLHGVDLSGVDLSGADLSGADLRGAYLSGAKLNGANLMAAKLSSTTLGGVDFSGANLSHANLFGANLSHANLFGANLSHANLFKAFGANFSGANLSYANFGESNFVEADLGELMARDMHPEDSPLGEDALQWIKRPTKEQVKAFKEAYKAKGAIIDEVAFVPDVPVDPPGFVP
jgi:uncharacterized protein YjbI with pentapeptide repeats